MMSENRPFFIVVVLFYNKQNYIKETNTKFIVFLDSDDFWLSQFSQTIYKFIQNVSNAGLYATVYKKRKSI